MLFVHGHGADMSTEWGALRTPQDGSGCNLSETPVTWQVDKNISHRRSWGIPYYKHGVLVRASMQDCAGTSQVIYPKANEPAISLGRTRWISCNSEVWWGSFDDCAQPLRGNTTAYQDGDPVEPVFHLDGHGSNFEDFSKTYTLNADQIKNLLIARDEFVAANSGGGGSSYPIALENLLDQPIAYLPSSTPRQIQVALALNPPPAENGLYFFNAKRQSGGFVHLNGLQPVPWNATFGGRPGQARQLYQRIVQVMDAFYVPQGIDWRTTSGTTIDLVGYSQGGLTIRALVDQMQNHPNDLDPDGRPFREVLDRINRIVAANTPHLGSALVTHQARLTNGIGHPQSPENLQFPFLGQQITNLLEPVFNNTVLEINDMDAVSVHLWDDVGLHLKLEGDSYLGPYTQTQGSIKVFGWDTENCSWYEWIIGGVTCMETFTYDFDFGDAWTALSSQTAPLQTTLNDLRSAGSHLTWSDATSGGVPTGDLIRDALVYDYPKNSTGANIEVTNLHSASAGAVMTALPDKIEKALYPLCVAEMQKQMEIVEDIIIDEASTCARMADKVSSGIVLRQIAGQFDADWSFRSDFVVEGFSQRGVLEGTDYDPSVNPQMRVDAFGRQELIHINAPFLEDHPRLAAYNQGCDILAKLGGACPMPAPPPAVPAEQRAFSLAPERLDLIESKAASARGAPAYKVRFRYTRRAPGVLSNLNLAYYFKEDPANLPQVSVASGGWTAALRHLEGSLYAVDLQALGVNLLQGQQSPEVELTFSNGSGRIWNPMDDWSSALSTSWQATRRIANSPRSGETIGLLPTIGDPAATGNTLTARALSKERRNGTHESKPYLALENTGLETLRGFRLRYIVRAPGPFELRQYWRTGQSQSTIATIPLGNGYYAIEVTYPTWVLQPGARIEEITFELNHFNWSTWELYDDPSYRNTSPATLLPNQNIMVFDMANNQIGGEDLSPLWDGTTDPASAYVEALNVASQSDYKRLDFRVRNDGQMPLYGVEMRFRMVTENGATPQVNFVDAHGCETAVVNFGSGRYEAQVKCLNVPLEPGQSWPVVGPDRGLRLEIQYGQGAPVNLNNDPSFVGIGSAWSPASGVLLFDREGSALSGNAPWP